MRATSPLLAAMFRVFCSVSRFSCAGIRSSSAAPSSFPAPDRVPWWAACAASMPSKRFSLSSNVLVVRSSSYEAPSIEVSRVDPMGPLSSCDWPSLASISGDASCLMPHHGRYPIAEGGGGGAQPHLAKRRRSRLLVPALAVVVDRPATWVGLAGAVVPRRAHRFDARAYVGRWSPWRR